MIIKLKCEKCGKTLKVKVNEENRKKATRCKKYLSNEFINGKDCFIVHSFFDYVVYKGEGRVRYD